MNRRETITAAWVSGRTGTDIGREFGISKQRVGQIVSGVPRPKVHRTQPRPRAAKTLAMAEAYRLGEAVNDIATRYGVNYRTVLIAARRCGIAYRRRCYGVRANR